MLQILHEKVAFVTLHVNCRLVVDTKETFKKKLVYLNVPRCSDKQISAIKGQETWQRQIKHLTFSLYMALSLSLCSVDYL